MTGFQKIENRKYFSLLQDAPFKTFFHNSAWEDFLEKEFSWMRFERYLWRDSALFSIARCRLLGKEKMVSHPFCEYGGPLSIKEDVDLESFISDFSQFFAGKARIKLHPYIAFWLRDIPLRSLVAPARPLAMSSARSPYGNHARSPADSLKEISFNQNRHPTNLATFWIEDFSKKTKEDLWQGFRKTLRQEIKKSEHCNTNIKECESESGLRQFYKLYVATTKRHKNIPLPFSLFNFFLNIAGSDPAKRGLTPTSSLFLAKLNGRIIGGSVFLFYKPFIHYFINSSDSKFRDYNVGHAILWKVMQKYVGGEYNYFDLGGTRKGSPLEVFKRGWGAEEKMIYEIGAAKDIAARSWKRKVWGMLPSFLMKKAVKYALFFKI